MHIKTVDFTISIHNWLQVLVLGDDIGYLTNCEISVFILLDNDNKRRYIKNPNGLLKNRLQNSFQLETLYTKHLSIDMLTCYNVSYIICPLYT